VTADRRRVQAGIDATEQHIQPGSDDVGNRSINGGTDLFARRGGSDMPTIHAFRGVARSRSSRRWSFAHRDVHLTNAVMFHLRSTVAPLRIKARASSPSSHPSPHSPSSGTAPGRRRCGRTHAASHRGVQGEQPQHPARRAPQTRIPAYET